MDNRIPPESSRGPPDCGPTLSCRKPLIVIFTVSGCLLLQLRILDRKETPMNGAVTRTNLNLGPVRRGKVRDIYDLGDRLLMISSDRISAFDWVLPTPIPDKGRVLTQISAFWFELLQTPHHLLSLDLGSLGLPPDADAASLAGRSMIVRKCEVVPIECVVRGYLEGSGWKEYQQNQAVCGIRLPAGLRAGFSAGRADLHSGHQGGKRARHQHLVRADGGNRRPETAAELRQRSIEIYRRGAEYARTKGILIADTKFEWGRVDGQLILIDEVLTPDSSRFWPADQYEPGTSQPSFDKQFVRDYLTSTGWDKNSDPPALPDEVVRKTRRSTSKPMNG